MNCNAKKPVSILLTLCLLLSLLLSLPLSASAAAPKADMSGYPGLTDRNHVFVTASAEDVQRMIQNRETFCVYTGRTGCPVCQEAVPVLNEAAKIYKQNVYYVNTDVTGTTLLLSMFEPYCVAGSNGYKRFFIPHVFFIRKGNVVENHLGTVPGHDPHTASMTPAQHAELLRDYCNGFVKELA
ncbi:MAG: thioredoxin family protein [Clostridia bacterium]|nr:thioredoxin family protein [Clostridia bacterium]